MSTADKLNKLLETKQAIKQAIIDKGVEVTDDTKFADYPSKIASIESGSSSGGGDPYYEELHNNRTNNGANFNYYFYYYPNTELDVSKLDTSKATSMNNMFTNSTSLTSINGIESMNVSNVSDANGMFNTCSSLSTLDLSGWNTSKIASANAMFQNCSGLTSLNVSGWDTSKVENMGDMFNGCIGLTSLDLSNFDTSNVTNMNYMFSCMQSSNLLKLDLSNFNTSKVTNMYGMFNWCIYLQELDIRNFELVHEDGTMAEISSMLEGCNSLHTLRLDNCSKATISKIINESGMPQEQVYDYSINENVNRKMYCKASEIGDLVAPNGWEFVTIE